MTPVLDLTDETAEAVLDKNEIALVLFGRPACPACSAFDRVFEASSKRYANLLFGRIDTVAQPELARAFDVRSVPTLAVIREQVLLLLQPGVLSEDSLEDVIHKATTMDMDALRGDIERESREEAR